MADEDRRRFHLAGEQDSFKQKAGTLFNALDDVSYTPTEESSSFLKGDPDRNSYEKHKTGNVSMRKGYQPMREGSESKDRAIMPPPRMRGMKRRGSNAVPGHVQNPSKYKKYSLADVKESDMSQKSNTAAAMAFLREIDQRQANEEKEEEQGGRIMFKKPTRKATGQAEVSTLDSSTSDKSSDSDSLKIKHQITNKDRSRKKQSITLSHLEYEDE